jgi:hypothetical protein
MSAVKVRLYLEKFVWSPASRLTAKKYVAPQLMEAGQPATPAKAMQKV